MDKIKKNNRSTKESEFLYHKLEKGGLSYINSQKNYLLLSIIFPIYAIIIQFINLIAILDPNPQRASPGQMSPPLLHILTPIIIVLVISSFALMNFGLLLSWKKKVDNYKKQNPKKSMTLTKIFYDIVENMETIKKFFIILNLISIYYFYWYLSWIFRITSQTLPLPPLHVNILNALLQIGLIIYLYLEWKHFLNWNQKLKELRKFEREIYMEISQSDL